MDDLVKAFYSIEVHLPSFWWIERVPSKSNPADEPSRLAGRQASIRWGAHFIQGFQCQDQVAGWLVQADRNRIETSATSSVWKRGKVETEPLQPNSSGHPKSPKLMDLCQQVGSVSVRTPGEISESQAFDFPPIQWKKGVECGCMKFRFIALSTWWTEIVNFFSGLKGFYTLWVLLSWNRYFESFMYWHKNALKTLKVWKNKELSKEHLNETTAELKSLFLSELPQYPGF